MKKDRSLAPDEDNMTRHQSVKMRNHLSKQANSRRSARDVNLINKENG